MGETLLSSSRYEYFWAFLFDIVIYTAGDLKEEKLGKNKMTRADSELP
jgi:hypothetical protein